VPAIRSRTERWRDCLRRVYERDGALEISVPQSAANPGADLVWRVRLAGMCDDHLVIEQPSAAGQWIELEPGVALVAGIAIGQNRWMFHTRVLPRTRSHPPRTVRLAAPTTVERCQRRNFFRISTAELNLPRVECWALLDPASVIAAEVANRARIMDLLRSGGASATDPGEDSIMLPEVGPKFTALLMNMGGGGAGLLIDKADAGALDRARLFWMRVNLTPIIPAPLGMTARLVHTHIDSSQSLYGGMAFEWAFNPPHRDFVIDQVMAYAAALQKRALLRSA
jgi:hypothetical protein